MIHKPSLLLHSMLVSAALCGIAAAMVASPAFAAPASTPVPAPTLEGPLKVTVPNLHNPPKKPPVMLKNQPQAAAAPFTGGTQADENTRSLVQAPGATVSLPWLIATPQDDGARKPFPNRLAATPVPQAPSAPDATPENNILLSQTEKLNAIAPQDTRRAAPTMAVYMSDLDSTEPKEPAIIKPRAGRDYAARAMMIRNHNKPVLELDKLEEAPKTIASNAPAPLLLADLSPAAGGDAAAAPAPAPTSPPQAVGTVPLIVLPEVDLPNTGMLKKEAAQPPAPTPPPPPAPAPAPAAVAPPPPPVPIAPVVVNVPLPAAPAAPEIKPQAKPEAKPAPVPAEELSKVIEAPAPAVSQPAAILPVIETPPVAAPAPVPEPKPAKKTAGKKAKKETPAAAQPVTEPGGLSPESRAVIGKLKAPVEKRETVPAFSVDRTHAMQDLFKGGDTSSIAAPQDTMGIKIETKRPAVNVDYELEKAYNALNGGQSEAAMLIYKNILSNDPNNVDALFGLATTYHRARQLDMARPLYSKLLTVAPNHREGFNNFLVLLADEAPQEALKELQLLEAKNPGFSPIPAQISIIYQKTGDLDKATQKMLRAMSLSPENLTYRYNLAIMMDKQKNYDEAARLYRQLVEAAQRGEVIPGNLSTIQQRLTFIGSNKH